MSGTTKIRFTLAQLNGLDRDQFTRVVGPVFEHSPWIAESVWPERPFCDVENLQHALEKTVLTSDAERQVALIRAHPDLVGKLALEGRLTAESAQEQAGAGLDTLSPKEIGLFRENNAAYQEKFGFPFVICARLNKKQAMIEGFQSRLRNSRETEVETALREIFKIAGLRLRDLIQD